MAAKEDQLASAKRDAIQSFDSDVQPEPFSHFSVLTHLDAKFDAFKNQAETKHDSLKLHVEEKIDRRFSEIERKLDKKNFLAVTLFLVVGLLGGVWGLRTSYEAASKVFQETLIRRLDEQFSSNQIKVLVEESARKFTENKAAALISNKVDENFKRAEAKINGVEKKLDLKLIDLQKLADTGLDSIRADQKKVIDLADYQKKNWEQASSVFSLINQAYEGSYSAFQKLMIVRTSREVGQIVSMNFGTLIKQIRGYMSPGPVQFGLTLHYEEAGKQVNAVTFDATKLIEKLEEPGLEEIKRQFLASLLAARPLPELAELGIKAFESEKSIYTLAVIFGRFAGELKESGVGLDQKADVIEMIKKWQALQIKAEGKR